MKFRTKRNNSSNNNSSTRSNNNNFNNSNSSLFPFLILLKMSFQFPLVLVFIFVLRIVTSEASPFHIQVRVHDVQNVHNVQNVQSPLKIKSKGNTRINNNNNNYGNANKNNSKNNNLNNLNLPHHYHYDKSILASIVNIRGGTSSSSSENLDDTGVSTTRVSPTKKKKKRKKKHDDKIIKSEEQTQIQNQNQSNKKRKKKEKSYDNYKEEEAKKIQLTKNTKPKSTTKPKSKPKPTTSSTKSSSSSSKSVGGGKSGACLRRIKNEWKEAVKLGIGYDWITKQTITTKGRSPSGKNELNNNDHFYNYNYIRIGPFHKNLLHWHFSIQGPSHSVYEHGIYHGRIILPKDYPGSPPRVQVLTPSGRFISGEDICLSASAFHPETWTPRWTIVSLVEALRMHMLTTANEIGGVNASNENREKFALYSRSWRAGCINHGQMVEDGLFCAAPVPDPVLDPVTLPELLSEQNKKKLNSNEEDSTTNDEQIGKIDELKENDGNQAKSGDDSLKVKVTNDEISTNSEDDFYEKVAFAIMTKEANKGLNTSTSSSRSTNSGVSTSTSSSSNTQQSVATSKRKNRLQKRPEKQKVLIVILRGIIEFFSRNYEFGIIAASIILFFKL